MTPKYKVGDIVRVKSWDILISDEEGPGINDKMKIHAGMEHKITKVECRNYGDGYIIYELEGAVYEFLGNEYPWVWAEEWLEPVIQLDIDRHLLNAVLML